MDSELIDVKLHIYDLTRGMAQVMSAAFLGVVVYGREYFFGGTGIQSCLPGDTVLGQPDQIHPLGATQIPYPIFIDYIRGLADSAFRGEAYDLLQHNCNNFSNEIAQFLCGTSIPQHILDLPSEVLSTPLGQSLQPLLNSLGASNPSGIPVLPLNTEFNRNREPSPEAIALENAIEDARRDSLKLEERRSNILVKVDKLEKKKAKQLHKAQQSESASVASSSAASSTSATPSLSKMAEQVAAATVETIQANDEAPKTPRDPPINYKDLMDVKTEYEALSAYLSKVGTEEDHQAMDELKQYVIDDEGSWALGDNFPSFISKWLNDDQPSNDDLRVKLLSVLSIAALKDDVILLLHQDRRDHVFMNYAHNIDRLPVTEQEALALFICNLFENSNSAEWLLYISEWTAPHTTSPLSNIRVTTKVAVTSLLSDRPALQERGTAIIYNLAIKEKMERTREFSDLLPRGSLSKVFDDVATELAMAILQFFSSEHCEEHIFRCMKGLVRFAYIAHSEVPALIKMIGPDPTQFKGMSSRIDELITLIQAPLRSAQ